MKSSSRKFAQKAIAVVVIVTLLYGAGVTPIAMLFVSGVIFMVFMVSRRSQNREVERIFDFYLAADAILRDENRRWYGFEVAEVIEQGENCLDSLPDPPPLQLFSLGALHNLLGNHCATEFYLSRVDDEFSDERYHKAPSPQLRRYVTFLRRIEAEPSMAPLTLGAVRSLERLRRRLTSTMLSNSRNALKIESESVPQSLERPNGIVETSAGSNTPRPSIQELLNDIYQDEEGPAN